MNLVALDGKIYRIGGMSPRNSPGTATDNYSTADNARFDPATRKWEDLPSLPEPRSSHDVVVVGNKIIVTGGWAIRGKRTDWADTLAILDLSAKNPAWTSARQPFHRRALMAAGLDDKMYVIGGFDEKSDIVRDVSVYDPATNAWSQGPQLPDGPGLSFAPRGHRTPGRSVRQCFRRYTIPAQQNLHAMGKGWKIHSPPRPPNRIGRRFCPRDRRSGQWQKLRSDRVHPNSPNAKLDRHSSLCADGIGSRHAVPFCWVR